MVGESARAEEMTTPPELAKGAFGDDCDRRTWEPGAGGGAQGALIQPE